MIANTEDTTHKNNEVTKYITDSVNSVTTDDAFLKTVQHIAALKKEKNEIQVIENEQDFRKIGIYFAQVKFGLKKLEEKRKAAIYIHQNVVSMINSIFKEPKTALQEIKDHFAFLLGTYETKLRQKKYEKDKEQQKNAIHEAMNTKPDERDIGPEEQDEIKAIVGVSKSSDEIDGMPNVKLRESIEVTVLNPETLLKAILSIQERNKDYTVDLVNFDIPALKKLAKTKRAIPGCTISKANRAI
jgi:hypothetical protein